MHTELFKQIAEEAAEIVVMPYPLNKGFFYPLKQKGDLLIIKYREPMNIGNGQKVLGSQIQLKKRFKDISSEERNIIAPFIRDPKDCGWLIEFGYKICFPQERHKYWKLW